MTTIKINNLNINMKQEGCGKYDVVCLHGWGQNLEMMKMVSEHLKQGFRVTSIDFPGFGDSQDPQESWNVQDYADFLHELLKKLQIENPILIGHSFGCRVAIRYAVNHSVHKMVLTGAAGIRPKRSVKWYVRTITYKVMKQLLKLPFLKGQQEKVKSKFGSSDYKNSTGIMRQTFVKVVNDDVSDLLCKMEMPVFLVWGDQDDATPLWMGKMMEAKMKNAGLAIFEGDGHYAYWHQWDRFNRCLDAFLGQDKGENDE